MTPQRPVFGRGYQMVLGILLAAAAAITAAGAQPQPPLRLYFVPIGTVPADMMSGLVSHVQTKVGVSSRTLPPLRIDPVTFDRERSQRVADRLIQAMRDQHPSLAKDPGARMIGITGADMYMEAMREQWAFTFSLRSADRRLAVVSYARMDPQNLGDSPNGALLRSRLRKMVIKNIGIMYFGLPGSANPRSVLYRDILGVDDLDRMTEDFEPK